MHKIVTLLKYFLVMVTVSVLGFFIFDVLSPIDTKAIQDTSRVVKFKDGSWMYATTNSEHKWRFPVDLKKIDPNFIRLLLAYEDQRFYEHYGVDPLAMMRAVGQLIQYKRVVSGGSTITMQLARLLDPKPRTVTSKLIEIVRALQLELHYSKEEILSAYLTSGSVWRKCRRPCGCEYAVFWKVPLCFECQSNCLVCCHAAISRKK